MARSSNKTKKWNIYSTHYSPANSSSTSNQTASSDQNELAPSRRSSSEYLPYGRQRSVFPYGIVSEYDLKNPRIGAETDAVVNVATVEIRFGTVVLIEKLVLYITYKKIGVATLTTASAQFHRAERNSIVLLLPSILFTQL